MSIGPIRVALPVLVILLQQLPPPFARRPWFRKPTRVVAMPDGHALTVPDGFSVNVFARDLQLPGSWRSRRTATSC
jgi:hypothetical protein